METTSALPYTPFLKLKQNEVMAVYELKDETKESLKPLFDFPKGKDESDEEIVKYTERISKQLSRYLGEDFPFYLDTFDIDDIKIDGLNSYEYILQAFEDCTVTPVVGIDRSDEHIDSVVNLLSDGRISNSTLAIRFQLEEMASYAAIEDEIDELLSDLISKFENIDIICDLRVCNSHKAETTVPITQRFITDFVANYDTKKVIVTGSSIPSVITDICPPQTVTDVLRSEIPIILSIENALNFEGDFFLGDYTVVSPDYSDLDIDGKLMRSRTASKLVYSFERSHRVWRGTTLKMEGNKQYNEHASSLVSSSIYRGNSFSWADNEFQIKSSLTTGFSPGSMIKHAVNAHIEFMNNIGV